MLKLPSREHSFELGGVRFLPLPSRELEALLPRGVGCTRADSTRAVVRGSSGASTSSAATESTRVVLSCASAARLPSSAALIDSNELAVGTETAADSELYAAGAVGGRGIAGSWASMMRAGRGGATLVKSEWAANDQQVAIGG